MRVCLRDNNYVHVLSLIPNLFYGVLVVYGYYGNGSYSGSM